MRYVTLCTREMGYVACLRKLDILFHRGNAICCLTEEMWYVAFLGKWVCYLFGEMGYVTCLKGWDMLHFRGNVVCCLSEEMGCVVCLRK